MMEEWRDIPSLPEYEASSLGRIRCKPIRRAMPYGGTRIYGGKPRQFHPDARRYTIMFRGRNYKVSRLVCEAFHGPAPPDKPNCLHGDENSTNNKPDNLSWGTQKENLNAPGFLAYCRSRTGKDNPYIKGRKT